MSQPLTPQELADLQRNLARGVAARQVAPGPMMLATLTPDSTEQRIYGGIPHEEVPVFEPMPWLPTAPGVAWGLNDRVTTLTNGTINVQAWTPMGFDFPSAIYAITAAVRTTDGSQISAAFGTVLDVFDIQFRLAQGRLWQTSAALGSSVCGTGERPRKLGRPCWRFNNGAVLRIGITPFLANLRIDIVCYTLETYGGSNIMPTL
jgi:hypothetical protein